MMFSSRKRILTFLGMILASASSSQAVIITFLGQDIPIPATFAGVSVNLETGEVSNDFGGLPGADANFLLGGEGISNDADQTSLAPTWQPVRSGTGNTDPVQNLTFGTTVDSNSVTGDDFGGSGGTTTHFPPFSNGVSGYIGFSLETSGATTAYGWMRVTLQNDNTEGVIHEWAYQDNGGAIPVGVIPEPTQGMLIAVGLSMLVLRRRRS
ncbi:MAG: PEP-CTERM sorting domain-containing protein [Verrucomicrobiales bacterium]